MTVVGHQAQLGHFRGALPVHPAPRAMRPARGEPEVSAVRVAFAGLAVNPPVAQRVLDRLVIPHARRATAGVADNEPYFLFGLAILRQPCTPVGGSTREKGVHVTPPLATRESPGNAGCTSRRGCSRMDRPRMR